MGRFKNLLCRLVTSFLVCALSAYSTAAFAQVFPVCSWPFESNGRGITNVATPDTHATYWIMPFDTASWKGMLIQGQYPRARFFNFDSYTATGPLIASIADSAIAPDPGSTNPFATSIANGNHDYSVTISAGNMGAPNMLPAGGTRLVFIVYRVYLPDQELDRTGGVGLPAISLVGRNGNVRRLRPCPFADAETSLGNLIISLAVNGFNDAANFLRTILNAAHQQPPITGLCSPSQAGPAAVAFAPATLGANFFVNPQTMYLETPGLCFQQGDVVVIRGKALVFQNTYLGSSVFQPAFDGDVQTRYWSMCNNDRVVPYPVIACVADFQTNLDPALSYTYVISNDAAPPTWLPAYATWLPWGATNIPKNLIFRIINEGGSPVSGPYVPVGAFCNEQLFIQQGWQGCFAAAGLPAE
jgi:hypothetical protein